VEENNHQNKERLELQGQINTALEKGSDITKAYATVLSENLNKEKEISQNLTDRVKTLSELVSIQNEDISTKEKSAKWSEMSKNAEKELAEIRDKQFNLEKQFGGIDDKRLKSAKAIKGEFTGLEDRARELEIIKQIADAENQRLGVSKELTDVQRQQSEALFAGFQKILGNIKKVPGGGMFLKAIGLGDANIKKMQENFNKFRTGEIKKFGDVFKVGGKNLGKMLGPALGIGIAIGAAVLLFKTMFKIAKAFNAVTDKMGEQFGVMGTGSNEVTKNLRSQRYEAATIGFQIKDLITATTSLADNFGIGVAESSAISSNILDSSKAMGLSVDQGAKLFGVLMSAGNMSSAMAERTAEGAYQLAAMNNVNPNAVMADMADSAEVIAKFGADNLESITKAAIQARKMGLSLKNVEGIASSLLDFQSSLNAEIEASLITGKTINLQKARELALTGDLDKMMAEVLKQMGGEAEFNKMNVFQRQSLAKSLNLSVSEMEKLVSAQDDTVTQSKSFVDLLGKDGMSALTSLMNEIKALGVIFVEKVGPHIQEIVQDLKNWLETGGIEKLVGFAEGLADVMVSIVQNMDIVMASLGAIMGASIGFMFGGPFGAAVGFFIGGALGYAGGSGISAGGGGAVDQSMMSANDFILTKQGEVIKTNPNDTIIGTQTPEKVFAKNREVVVNNSSNERMMEITMAINKTNERLDKMIEDNDGFFGTNGTAVKGITMGVTGGIQDSARFS
jgi:hypothetical protein